MTYHFLLKVPAFGVPSHQTALKEIPHRPSIYREAWSPLYRKVMFILWPCSIFCDAMNFKKGLSVYLQEKEASSHVTCLEVTSDDSLVKVSLVYYVMLYIMSPFGTSSIQEMVSWCCTAEGYFKIPLSAHSSAFQEYSRLALMVGSEKRLAVVDILRGSLLQCCFNEKEGKHRLPGISGTSKSE